MEKDVNIFFYETTCLLGSEQKGTALLQFKVLKGSQFQCVYFEVDNSSYSLRLLVYLLNNSINIYIASSVHNGKKIPAFCDAVILNPKAFDTELTLIRNENFVRSESLQINSGSILMSTSGSTGKPKFIVFEKSKLLSNGQRVVTHLKLNRESRVLVPVPVGHMFGLGVGVIPGLIAGAGIHLIEKNNILKLYEQLQIYRPDVTLITPAMVDMMLQFRKPIVKTKFISAGDHLDHSVAKEFQTSFGTLINLYGCSEMGAMGTSADDYADDHNIIFPLEGVALKIDQNSSSEILCFRDDRFKFYVDEFGDKTDDDNGGWYRTNDRGEATSNGGIRVLGRLNDTINRLGFLLSYNEIEIRLQAEFPDFQKILITKGKHYGMHGVDMVAFFEYHIDFTSQRAEQVWLQCKSCLQNHLKPDYIYFVKKLPRLQNGKIDRVTINEKLINYEQTDRHEKYSIIG
jgi:acyl-coenzyme A synthetase/AMP-(fatty) acid ligase